MKFGIIFDKNQSRNLLIPNPKLIFGFFFLSIALFILLSVLEKIIGSQNFGIILYAVVGVIAFFLIKTEIIFDAGYIIWQSSLGIMKRQVNFGEIKSVTIDELKYFHVILDNNKEFVFRARRRSEHEDLRNQFYSVGLYKEDIRK